MNCKQFGLSNGLLAQVRGGETFFSERIVLSHLSTLSFKMRTHLCVWCEWMHTGGRAYKTSGMF